MFGSLRWSGAAFPCFSLRVSWLIIMAVVCGCSSLGHCAPVGGNAASGSNGAGVGVGGVGPVHWSDVARIWRRVRLFSHSLSNQLGQESEIVALLIQGFAAGHGTRSSSRSVVKSLAMEQGSRPEDSHSVLADGSQSGPAERVPADSEPKLERTRRKTGEDLLTGEVADGSNATTVEANTSSTTETVSSDFATPSTVLENDVTRTTYLIITSPSSGVTLDVLELIAIIGATFIGGFVVGALAVGLMAMRRRRRYSVSSSEVVSNPMFDSAADARDRPTAANHPTLRALPSSFSAVTQRFQRPGLEEGYFVPDEGWAVVTANDAVEDVNIPIAGSAAGAESAALVAAGEEENGNSVNSDNGQRSPQPSDNSLPAVEHSEMVRKHTGKSSNAGQESRYRKFANDRSLSLGESMTGSIPEDGMFLLPPDQRSSYAPAGDAAAHNEITRSKPVHWSGVDGAVGEHGHVRVEGLRRASSADRVDSGQPTSAADRHRQAPRGNGEDVAAALQTSLGSRNFYDSHSDPGSPQGKGEAGDRGSHLRSLGHGEAHPDQSSNNPRDHHHHGNNTTGLPVDARASHMSHVSAPLQLEPLVAGSQLSLCSASCHHELSRLSNVDESRVLSWVQSQERIAVEDFEIKPSDGEAVLSIPSEVAADGEMQAESVSLTGMHSAYSRHRQAAEQRRAIVGRANSARAIRGQASEGVLVPLSLQHGSVFQRSASGMIVGPAQMTSSTSVLFPQVTQTFESHVLPVADHPLASPPEPVCFTPSSQPSRDGQRLAAAAGLVPRTTPGLPARSGLTPAGASAQQRLSMHPVDVMEMDQMSHTQGSSPPSAFPGL